MTEEKTTKTTAPVENIKDQKTEVTDTNKGASEAVAKSVYGTKAKAKKFEKKGRGKIEKKDDFEQRILDIARVTRVMAGGKRMRFRACVVIGDKKGKVGVGLGKGADVTVSVTKAVNDAKKDLIDVPIINETIPHQVYNKSGAAKILFKPASLGKGVIAGGVVRVILELAGIKNISSKILGTSNKVNNAKCTIEALRSLKHVEDKKVVKKEEAVSAPVVVEDKKIVKKAVKEEKSKK